VREERGKPAARHGHPEGPACYTDFIRCYLEVRSAMPNNKAAGTKKSSAKTSAE